MILQAVASGGVAEVAALTWDYSASSRHVQASQMEAHVRYDTYEGYFG